MQYIQQPGPPAHSELTALNPRPLYLHSPGDVILNGQQQVMVVSESIIPLQIVKQEQKQRQKNMRQMKKRNIPLTTDQCRVAGAGYRSRMIPASAPPQSPESGATVGRLPSEGQAHTML